MLAAIAQDDLPRFPQLYAEIKLSNGGVVVAPEPSRATTNTEAARLRITLWERLALLDSRTEWFNSILRSLDDATENQLRVTFAKAQSPSLSKNLRLLSNEPLAHAARSAGCDDPRHMSRLFHGRMGVTPGAYRMRGAERGGPPCGSFSRNDGGTGRAPQSSVGFSAQELNPVLPEALRAWSRPRPATSRETRRGGRLPARRSGS